MEATNFETSTKTLSPPDGETEDNIHSLFVQVGYITVSDGGKRPIIVSCFKPTKQELEEINETGRVWLGVMGFGMGPVILSSKNPLETE